MKYIFKVQNFDGELAVFLLQSGVSSRQVTRLRKEAGLIRCNGQVVFTNAKVKDGDVVEWRYTCDLGNDVGGGYAVGG